MTDQPELTADQVAYLRAIYEHFHRDAAWPPAKDLHRELTQDDLLEVFRAGQSISGDFILANADARGAVALRLAGMYAAVGKCEETDDFIAVVRLAVERYRQRGAEPKLFEAEFKQLGITDARFAKFNLLSERFEFVVGPSGSPGSYTYEISQSIDSYLDVRSIQDFLRAYVRVRAGRDHRFGLPTGSSVSATDSVEAGKRRRVFVVHGRNGPARDAVTALLRAFGLEPLLFRDALAQTRSATPYVGDVLERGFDLTFATVVLMTPDDVASLSPQHVREHDPDYEKRPTGQARPNVLFEAGMGWSAHRDRTVIMHLGHLRPLTDLEGLHVLHFDGSPESRHELGRRLAAAGCPIDFTAGMWLSAGDFTEALSVAGGSAPTRAIDLVFDPLDPRCAVEHWADGPHRLFGRSYRIGITNLDTKSIDGVRLLLEDVVEHPYRPVYLRVMGDQPPFDRSNDGVRVDGGGTAFFDVAFFNQETPGEEVQFACATQGEPNLRPAGAYTLRLVAEARDTPPLRASYRTWVDPGYGLRFVGLGASSLVLVPTTGPGSDVRLELRNMGPALSVVTRCRIQARRNDAGGQPLRSGVYTLRWTDADQCTAVVPSKSSRSVIVATFQISYAQRLVQVDLPECTADGVRTFESSRWNFDSPALPEYDVNVEAIADGVVVAGGQFVLRPRAANGPIELLPRP